MCTIRLHSMMLCLPLPQSLARPWAQPLHTPKWGKVQCSQKAFILDKRRQVGDTKRYHNSHLNTQLIYFTYTKLVFNRISEDERSALDPGPRSGPDYHGQDPHPDSRQQTDSFAGPLGRDTKRARAGEREGDRERAEQFHFTTVVVFALALRHLM